MIVFLNILIVDKQLEIDEIKTSSIKKHENMTEPMIFNLLIGNISNFIIMRKSFEVLEKPVIRFKLKYSAQKARASNNQFDEKHIPMLAQYSGKTFC
jgi:hypothetical protein